MQPASTIIVLFKGSTVRIRFMRASDSTIARPDVSGVAPPTMPVLPPCGTIAVCASSAKANNAGDLLGQSRPYDGERAAREALAPVRQIGCGVLVTSQHIGRTDDRADQVQQAHCCRPVAARRAIAARLSGRR